MRWSFGPSSRKQLKPTLVLVPRSLLSAAVLVSELLPWWLGAAACSVLAAILLIGFVGIVRPRRAPWEIRLDAAGVTARGQRTVACSELTAVRLTRMFPAVPFGVVHTEVAAFLRDPASGCRRHPRARHRAGSRLHSSTDCSPHRLDGDLFRIRQEFIAHFARPIRRQPRAFGTGRCSSRSPTWSGPCSRWPAGAQSAGGDRRRAPGWTRG